MRMGLSGRITVYLAPLRILSLRNFYPFPFLVIETAELHADGEACEDDCQGLRASLKLLTGLCQNALNRGGLDFIGSLWEK